MEECKTNQSNNVLKKKENIELKSVFFLSE